MRKRRAKLLAAGARQDVPDEGELELIRLIQKRVASQPGRVQLGIGDDCALLRLKQSEDAAVTTDMSIDGRHFRLDWHPPESVGHRTLARGLSDLAAMGARPLGAFLSLGLPRELARIKNSDASNGTAFGGTWIERFLDGLLKLAAQHAAVLAGGDLAESSVAVADIVLVGAVPRRRALLRSGARPGDQLYVTGALGGAAHALDRLRAWATETKPRSRRNRRRLSPGLAAELAAHLYPEPRLEQGQWLQSKRAATAAIDISDGLSTDLAHLCEESGTAAEVNAELLPVHAGATLEQALHGGEDYELLFTARKRIPDAIAGVAVTHIGRMVPRQVGQPQIVLLTDRGKKPLMARGWQHFS